MEEETFAAFLRQLEINGRLETTAEKVSCDLEAAEIARRSAGISALLFKNPEGSSFSLVLNAFVTKNAVLSSIGLKSVEEAPAFLLDTSVSDLFPPKICENPPFFENIFDDLTSLPAIRTWEKDGGFALTLPTVITGEGRDVNCGMYRVQIIDKKRAIVHCKSGSGASLHIDRARLNGADSIRAAICLGAPPSVMLASVMPVDDEFAVAGALTGRRLKITEADGVYVPFYSEIVLTGTISVNETAAEGPFGNYTGGYSEKEDFPVFTFQKGFFKNNAVCPNTVAGLRTAENIALADTAFRLLTNSFRKTMPELVTFGFPNFGVFGGMVFIALNGEVESERIASHPFFGRYKNICLFDGETDTEDSAECLRLFANSSEMIYNKKIRIFKCSLKSAGRLRTTEKVINTVDKNTYGFCEWIKRKQPPNL